MTRLPDSISNRYSACWDHTGQIGVTKRVLKWCFTICGIICVSFRHPTSMVNGHETQHPRYLQSGSSALLLYDQAVDRYEYPGVWKLRLSAIWQRKHHWPISGSRTPLPICYFQWLVCPVAQGYSKQCSKAILDMLHLLLATCSSFVSIATAMSLEKHGTESMDQVAAITAHSMLLILISETK